MTVGPLYPASTALRIRISYGLRPAFSAPMSSMHSKAMRTCTPPRQRWAPGVGLFVYTRLPL